MKKSVIVIFLLICMLVILVACGNNASSVLNKDSEYNVLFVGDSYTYYNNLPDLFLEMTASAGYNFKVSVSAMDVKSLLEFSDVFSAAGKDFGYKLTENTDFLVIQENSRTSTELDSFKENISLLEDTIDFSSANPTCYLTQLWGEDFDVIKGNADVISGEYDYTVSPVGSVFEKILEVNDAIVLYHSDGTPTLEGSYAIALCHFCTITGEKADSVSYNPAIDTQTIKVIKEAVNSIFFN